MRTKSRNGCIITPPMGNANMRPLYNISKICAMLFSDLQLILISSNVEADINPIIDNCKPSILNLIYYSSPNNYFDKILFYTYSQLKSVFFLIKGSRNKKIYVFYLADTLLLQMIVAKILRKKVLLIIGADVYRIMSVKRDPFAIIFKLFIYINYALANRLIVYSPNMVNEYNLKKFEDKISFGYEHAIDICSFRIEKYINERSLTIGFIGRLSEEKGVLNFAKSISIISNINPNINFIIGGDGHLRDAIIDELRSLMNHKVILVGWIPYDELPRCLNELRLLVLPSYTEGLPNIVLEAMACGTPVLATPVGAILDIIEDGETGFIMKNNSPQCIAENVSHILGRSNLKEISENARAFIEQNFTFNETMRKWEEIFNGNFM